MEREYTIYAAYVLFFTAFVGLLLATPLLAFTNDVQFVYDAFSPTCHQKLSRSLCVFSDDGGYWIADCAEQTGEFITEKADRSEIRVEKDGMVGYKMPVCSRDVALYGAMLFGGLIYPIVRNLKERRLYPAIYLILAIVPLAIDGTLQIISEAGLISFVYESTNLIREATGVIAGVAAAFYTIPLLMNFFTKEEKIEKKSARKRG